MEYIKHALSDSCQPVLFDPDSFDESCLDRSVLDARCSSSSFLEKVDEFLSDSHVPDSNTKALLTTLRNSISKLNRPDDYKFILSLSGGVDSMSLLVMLVKLGIKFVAVHIRHSSRCDETEKELQWVQFVCKKLKVTLFHHHVLVARPHGISELRSSEISRDEFEDYTRRIRFLMYRRALPCCPTVTVLIGHHLDDVDENRIAELGKGNLINIDGMAEDMQLEENIVVVRPLCANTRKDQIRQFALAQKIPHMKNSTPIWSKRGWIRDVLDSCDSNMNESFLHQLDDLGKLSNELDCAIDAVVNKWIETRGITSANTVHVNAKSKQFSIPCGSLNISSLELLLDNHAVPEKLSALASSCNLFGTEWNNKVSQFCAERNNFECPIQNIRFLDPSYISNLNAIALNRCFQKSFSLIQSCIPVERYISQKSTSQLLESLGAKTVKCFLNWKINNLKTDVSVLQIQKGSLYVLHQQGVDDVVDRVFAGSRDAFKKTIISNVDRIVIV